MARRRKSNGNSKITKDSNTKDKNKIVKSNAKNQLHRNPSVKRKIKPHENDLELKKEVSSKRGQKSTDRTIHNKAPAIIENDSNTELDGTASPKETVSPNDENPNANDLCSSEDDSYNNKLQLLDIQQMILGDIQNTGQGEGIIVSRQTGADISEDDVEEAACESGTVVELPKEEYEINTEEEEEGEEEEVILMTEEDDGEEIQYAIVVNSDFEMPEGSDHEVVDIHNLSDFQEGSCKIITVVRESDYDSSQESIDEVEGDECDNITAVIGSVDSIHCVNISQYNSEDESSNHDDSFEKEEIKVTEHEVACFSQIDNSLNVLMVDSSNNHLLTGTLPQISECTEEKETNILHLNEIDEKETRCSLEGNADENLEKDQLTKPIEKEEEMSVSILSDQEEITNNNIFTDSKIDNDHSNSKMEAQASTDSKIDVFSNSKIESEDTTDPKIGVDLSVIKEQAVIKETDFGNGKTLARKVKINKQSTSKSSSINSKKTPTVVNKTHKNNNATAKGHLRDKCKDNVPVNHDIKPILSDNRSPDSSGDSEITNEIKVKNEDKKNDDENADYTMVEASLNSLQEQKVTSNSNISAGVVCSNTIPIKNDCSQSSKEDSFTFMFSVQNSTNSIKIENKLDPTKEEVSLKDDEEKHNTFRSRSGSTDTTGSESGSNSSSSRRRSGRIRSICATKQSEIDQTCKAGHASSLGVVTSTTSTPPVPGYERDKPVKVKSRWRRSSELEMGSNNKKQQELEVLNANARLQEAMSSTPLSRPGQPTTPPDTPPPDKEVEDILVTFNHLDSNEYLTDRSRSKEAKRMVCDCTLTKEEISRGDMGCGEDCLNRLLMIECGARCMLGERCANKRFQTLEYAKCEVFKTEMKGYGLRALNDIPVDTFLLEYVGEVIDPKEFRRRAKDYSKDKNLHFYFMALKSDAIIDATQKGNISRFINHSCDPNAETQKWTVNGELRIGFFSKRAITAGEEITFDYQLERYGKEAQRCYCQSAQCRGWIGEDPEKENKWSDLSGRGRERRERERKKKEDKRVSKDMLNDIDLEEEIEKLVLKNRAQTLLLCRLMVRAEDHRSRVQLLHILQKGETACLRLFLDYHGLRLIWSWMMDPSSTSGLKVEILETLAMLPIPNKTMLQDSKVLSVVEKWSTAAQNVAEAKDRSSTEEESDKGEGEKDKLNKGVDSDKNSDDSNSCRPVETDEQQETNKKKMMEIANNLLKDWSSLKEVFRIPKKERIEQMKEHEREADKMCRDGSVESQEKSYDRHRNQDKYRTDYDKRDKEKDRDRKRGRDSPDSDKARKSSKLDDKQAQMLKMERRHLFAIKAAQEDEERQRRQQQESLWQEQVQIAAHELAAAQNQQAQQHSVQPFPPPQQWMAFPPPDPNMMPPQHQHMEGQPIYHNSQPPPPFMFNQGGPLPPPHMPPPFHEQPPFHNPMFAHPPHMGKQPLLPTPNQPLLGNPQLPNQPLLPSPNQPLLPNPQLSNPPFIPNQPNQPLLPTPPIPNQSRPINLPPFVTQPPIPNQPPPIVITSQPPPIVIPPPTNSMVFPQEINPAQHFPNTQNQFNQPPPFPSQPPAIPLPNLPPTQNAQPVFQNPLPAQFQPPLPQPTATPTVVPVTSTVSSVPVPMYLPTPVRLPPKWKSAKDAEGRTYYYHIKTRISQWEPPLWEHQQQQLAQVSESETDSSDSDDDDSSSEDEEQEEDKVTTMEEDTEPVEEILNDDLGCDDLGDSPYEPETMELLEDIVEDTKKKRKDILVQERIISSQCAQPFPLSFFSPYPISGPEPPPVPPPVPPVMSSAINFNSTGCVPPPPRTADEIPDKLDKKKIRELKEKLKRQKVKDRRLKQKSSKSKGRSSTSKCEADTSSDPGRKIKDAFRLNMAGVIVHYLNAYRKPDCKFGKITNTEDFKHLARKLTHFVMLKELKHCRSVDELDCNDNVKHKARDFIKKYMSKFGAMYQRPSDDD